jgi:cobalt-zinc-cadmium efflux system protein
MRHRMQLSERKRLGIVLAVTALYFVVELAGGFLTGSLALLSDAVHMLTDIAALCLSLFTLWISSRPATSWKTYGYLRAEILGALLNGLLLWMLVVFIAIEAIERLRNPHAVQGLPVIGIALVGLAVNAYSAWMTRDKQAHGRAGIAVRAIFLHVIADLVGSAGVLLSGAIIFLTGWTQADPLVSLFISVLIIIGSWELVREGVDILMESTPSDIDLDELRRDLLSVAGTEEVHDLHVWCLTSRELALSAHAVVVNGANSDRVLSEMSELLERKFSIRHMTVQIEHDSRRPIEPDHF